MAVKIQLQGNVGLDKLESIGDGERSADSRFIWKVELRIADVRIIKEPCQVFTWAAR